MDIRILTSCSHLRTHRRPTVRPYSPSHMRRSFPSTHKPSPSPSPMPTVLTPASQVPTAYSSSLINRYEPAAPSRARACAYLVLEKEDDGPMDAMYMIQGYCVTSGKMESIHTM
ncbi:hypothetical protein BDN70DRAFT_997790 [Pholiota conissans]|uniref:Uncharacterized protein n=1 Tax=Pholiota conissans TaxID=109636 RepID=A0A9P6CUH0_9AGAR|nr:hypothetical protein BDN70DRAFT_997790 [Pholiota conissans]